MLSIFHIVAHFCVYAFLSIFLTFFLYFITSAITCIYRHDRALHYLNVVVTCIRLYLAVPPASFLTDQKLLRLGKLVSQGVSLP